MRGQEKLSGLPVSCEMRDAIRGHQRRNQRRNQKLSGLPVSCDMQEDVISLHSKVIGCQQYAIKNHRMSSVRNQRSSDGSSTQSKVIGCHQYAIKGHRMPSVRNQRSSMT